MKPNELKIGNLINTGKFHIPKYRGNYAMKEGWFKYAWRFTPIPITEEWLLNFDLKNKLISSNFSKDLDGFFMWFNGNKIYIKYVHQLQNLYFALTNEELTYERIK